MRFLTLLSASIGIFMSMSTAAQTRVVSGKVLVDSLPLPGVNIIIKGTTRGTSSDFNGNYQLEVPASDSTTLIYSFVGYKAQEVVLGQRREININLLPDVSELEAVIVSGYRSETRADITGAISSISVEDFEDMAVASPDMALQGLAAGVQVTQSSGTPGGGIKVNIRGNTSISASNRPLFIIDGIPVQDGNLGLRSFGGQQDNALSALNPNDIENIQVLKDAATKAIYGSRAANGVVLITTKRGKAGRTNINVDVQRGVVNLVNKVQMMNATQLLDLQREAVENAGEEPDAFGLIRGVTDAVDTDWLDEILRQGVMEQYQLSLRGGDQKTRFYMSSNFRREEGVQLNNQFIRASLALNLDHQINEKLSIGNNLTITRLQNDRVKGDNFLDGVYSGAIKSLPFASPFNEQGELVGPGSGLYPGFPNFNPVGQALLPRFRTYTTKMLGGLFLNYRHNENISFRTKLSVDYNSVIEDQFEPTSTAIGGFLNSVGFRGYGVYITGQYVTTIQGNTMNLQYSWGSHNLSSVVGTEVIYQVNRTSSVQGRLFPSDDFTYITSAGIVDQGSSFFSENGLASVFGEAKYDYEKKYIASVTMRADASSRFGQDQRVGYFPGVSAAWQMGSEPFLDNTTWLDDLKLRASYGFTGNERIPSFEFLGTFAPVTYNGITGTGPASLGNPNLQWESTAESNFGVDAGFLKGRIQTTLELYNSLTSDLLLNEPFPFTTGFGGIRGNIGNVRNRGVEFRLTSDNLTGELGWQTEINLSRNQNVVLSLADSLPIFTGYSGQGVSSTSVIKEGEPLGTFWGLEFLGVDPATGDAIYEDINGDGLITSDDGTVLGNAQPDFIGSMTNNFTYKNFDLSIFMMFSYGNDILNFSHTSLLNTGQDILTNQNIRALERWQEPGDITDIPRYELGNTFNNLHSSRFIEDGSFFRIKNISLGYTLPERIISAYRINNARIYVSGVNIFTLTRYTGGDPEVSTLDGSTSAQGIDLFTLPQVKTWLIGLKISL